MTGKRRDLLGGVGRRILDWIDAAIDALRPGVAEPERVPVPVRPSDPRGRHRPA